MRSFIFIVIICCMSFHNSLAHCSGKFINPITDVCWSCLFPISIGNVSITGNSKKDTKNPSNPLCVCRKGSIPKPGLSVGYWQPYRTVEVVREPFCMVGLGGLNIGPRSIAQHGTAGLTSTNTTNQHSFYHVHVYDFNILTLFNIITNLGCGDNDIKFDIAYMTELDPMWDSDALSALIQPENIIYANPLAQAACVADCTKATLDKPIDAMHWCAGCQGSIYPLSGFSANHIDGVETSSLLAQRLMAKLHRLRAADITSSSKKALCSPHKSVNLKKSQYKLQMVYPVANASGDNACNFFGKTTSIWSSGKKFPIKGEDFNYILWRKRNCCVTFF